MSSPTPIVGISPVFDGVQFFDNNGQMLNGGYVYSYQAGSFTVQQPTYTDHTGTVANPNPIQLSSTGRLPYGLWLDTSLTYNLAVTLSDGNTIIETAPYISALNTQNIVTTDTITSLAPSLTGTGASGNWNITAAISTVANSLGTTTTPVVVNTALAPTVGQILTATGGTTASWQTLPTTSNVLPGTIINFAGNTAPSGYLVCPTTQTNISRTTYSVLFTAIGTAWGVGDGVTTFGMPWFPIGYTMIQPNVSVGTSSVGSNLAHTHDYASYTNWFPQSGSSTPCWYGSQQVATSSSGGSANLPAGSAVLFCVKY